jgi:hypothetical protein
MLLKMEWGHLVNKDKYLTQLLNGLLFFFRKNLIKSIFVVLFITYTV